MKKILIFILTAPFLLFSQKEFNVKLYDSYKIYSIEELENFLPIERELLKAEILARYGYIFNDSLLQRYFLKQIWYKPISKDFPLLNRIDSINYETLTKLNVLIKRIVFENIKKFKPFLDGFYKSYYSYCFENSALRSIAKRKFKLKPFNYCYRQVFYIPRLELPVDPLDFERFLSEDDFNLNNYIFFKRANDVRGIIFMAYFTKDKRLIQLDEVGVDPGLNLGKTVTENHLDDKGRIFVHYNKMCNEDKIEEIARILTYDDDKIVKEILLIQDDNNIYVQITTLEYFIETGLKRNKD